MLEGEASCTNEGRSGADGHKELLPHSDAIPRAGMSRWRCLCDLLAVGERSLAHSSTETC